MSATSPADAEAGITVLSLDVFLGYAEDAVNWGGTPPLGGGGGGSAQDRGNLTQLKKAGLIETFVDEGGGGGNETWIRFTDKGHDLAAQHGITIGR